MRLGLFVRGKKMLVRRRRFSSPFSSWMREGEEKLSYLPDVRIASKLVQAGRHDEGIVMLQRVVQVMVHCKMAK